MCPSQPVCIQKELARPFLDVKQRLQLDVCRNILQSKEGVCVFCTILLLVTTPVIGVRFFEVDLPGSSLRKQELVSKLLPAEQVTHQAHTN